jgi:surface protein
MDSNIINLADNDDEELNSFIKNKMNFKKNLLIAVFVAFLIIITIFIFFVFKYKTNFNEKYKDNIEKYEEENLSLIECIYKVNSNNQIIKLLGDEFIKSFEIDRIINGKKENYTKIFNFQSIGDHLIQFRLYTNNFSMDYMFKDVINLKSIKMISNNSCEINSMVGTFQNCENLEIIENNGFNTNNIKSMRKCFYNTGLFRFNFTTININTSGVLDMAYMFSSIKVEKLNIYNLNANNALNMSHMFENCFLLTSLELIQFYAGKAIDMSYMFSSCFSLKELNLDNFKTNNTIINMSSMFMNCNCLIQLDLSKFQSKYVEDMSGMFKNCISINSINLNNFIIKNVKNI